MSWAEKSVPDNFHFSLLDSDYDHFEQIMNNALGRVPKLETAGIKELINGPESFTPDGNFILGESPCLLYTSPSPRDVEESRMPSSA